MRTFIAIELDRPIQARLGELQRSLQPTCLGLRWVRPEMIHLTVRFLGEISDRQIEPISRVLQRLAETFPPIEIEYAGVGTFPEHGPVRVVWVGVHDCEGNLARYHAACDSALAELGIPSEGRAFTPHLTVARNKELRRSAQIRQALAAHVGYSAERQTAEDIVLFASRLDRDGPQYTPLSRHPLAG